VRKAGFGRTSSSAQKSSKARDSARCFSMKRGDFPIDHTSGSKKPLQTLPYSVSPNACFGETLLETAHNCGVRVCQIPCGKKDSAFQAAAAFYEKTGTIR